MAKLVAALLLSLLPFSPAFSHDSDPTEDLLRAIKKARLIDLSHTWEIASPVASVNPPYSFSLSATHGNTRGSFGDGGQLSFTSEVMGWSGQHGAPSIDAIGHIGRDGKLFGGVDAAASTSNPDGIGANPPGVGAHLAIDKFPQDLLINRGVLLDVASMEARRHNLAPLTPLPADFEITAQHLRDAAERQKVKVKKGDTVFIRTGWGPYFKGSPSDRAFYSGASSPGRERSPA